jgi:hypothetical protein
MYCHILELCQTLSLVYIVKYVCYTVLLDFLIKRSNFNVMDGIILQVEIKKKRPLGVQRKFLYLCKK